MKNSIILLLALFLTCMASEAKVVEGKVTSARRNSPESSSLMDRTLPRPAGTEPSVSKSATAVRFAPTGSMNYSKTDFKTDSRIDHVLVSKQFDVLDYTVLTYSYWSEVEPSAEALADIEAGKEGVVAHKHRLPSDHYPIGIHLNFK